jgi:hypothetical protein
VTVSIGFEDTMTLTEFYEQYPSYMGLITYVEAVEFIDPATPMIISKGYKVLFTYERQRIWATQEYARPTNCVACIAIVMRVEDGTNAPQVSCDYGTLDENELMLYAITAIREFRQITRHWPSPATVETQGRLWTHELVSPGLREDEFRLLPRHEQELEEARQRDERLEHEWRRLRVGRDQSHARGF